MSIASLAELLKSLGVPVAITTMVILSLTLWGRARAIARSAAVLAILMTLAFGIIELYPRLRKDVLEDDITLVCEPNDPAVFTQRGVPIDLSIRAVRAGTELCKREVPRPDPTLFQDRDLDVQLSQRPGTLEVSAGSYPLGTILSDTLRGIGWRDSVATGSGQDDPRHVWSTRKVTAGQVVVLGDSSKGRLSIQVIRLLEDGSTEVTLDLQGHPPPDPASLIVKNKSLDSQVFEGTHEFFVAVREADFTSPEPTRRWVAFTVMGP